MHMLIEMLVLPLTVPADLLATSRDHTFMYQNNKSQMRNVQLPSRTSDTTPLRSNQS